MLSIIGTCPPLVISTISGESADLQLEVPFRQRSPISWDMYISDVHLALAAMYLEASRSGNVN